MSIWGKVIGGVAGLAIGGPLGALLGAAAGHAVDKFRSQMKTEEGGPEALNASKQVAFTMAVIVLSAKMAKADGQVTRDEVDAFKQIFHVPPEDMAGIGAIFNEARKDAEGFEPYAKQIAQMFAFQPAVLEELLGGLFHIAKADGIIHPAEMEFLEKVATIFGFGHKRFERIKASYLPEEGKDDPYTVLGLEASASDDEIKTAYRQLIRENHPDTVIAQGMPQEFIDIANEKMASINAAYDTVKKQRGL